MTIDTFVVATPEFESEVINEGETTRSEVTTEKPDLEEWTPTDVQAENHEVYDDPIRLGLQVKNDYVRLVQALYEVGHKD